MKRKIFFVFTVIFLISVFLVGCDEEGKEEGEVQEEAVSSEIKEENAVDLTETLYSFFVKEGFVGEKEELISLLAGKSAYDIACENGFEGTEQEWIASLTQGKESVWNVGEGEPVKEGKEGDIYLEINTLDLYYRSETGWEKLANIGQKEKKEEVYHTVTFFLSESEKATKRVLHGECVTLPSIDNKDKFLGWYTEDDEKFTSFYPVARDLDLYPKYERIKYKIRYFVDGNLYTWQEYYFGDVVVGAEAQDVENFVEWKFLPERMPAEDVNVTAKILGKYIVVFKDGEKTIDTQVVSEGESAVPPTSPQKEGYDFVGWNGSYQNITEDSEIYAEFSKKEYTVRFFTDEEQLITEEKVLFGESATEPIPPEKEGFEFYEWDTEFSDVRADLDVRARYRNVGSEQTDAVEYFIFDGENDLYYRENGEVSKVRLNNYYTGENRCEEILSDPALTAEGWSFDMDPEIKTMNLADFIDNGRCIVGIKVLIGGVWKDCDVEVEINPLG